MVPALDLSVVIPVYNEPVWTPRVVADLAAAVANAPLGVVELIVVDDGSDEPTRRALASLEAPFPVRVVRQDNLGRFAARRRGIEEARHDTVLLLDSRVSIRPDALRFVAESIRDRPDRIVWNAHVVVEVDGNPYARFWNVLTEIAFREYFDHPRTTSYGLERFDRYPKGTTCFLAPRALLRDAITAFDSHYDDVRDSNDDTLLIRHIAGRTPVNISPGFACLYRGRNALRPFLRHTRHRGVVFVDGFLRPGSRFRIPLLAFYPGSAAALLLAVRRPNVALGAALLAPLAWAGLGLRYRRSARDVATLTVLGPMWMVAYGWGVWRGGLAAMRARRSP